MRPQPRLHSFESLTRVMRRAVLGLCALLAIACGTACIGPTGEAERAPVSSEPLVDAASNLSIQLSLDHTVYRTGEPIFATVTLRNVGTTMISLELGGDYRSGRLDRFHFKVKDPEGRPSFDPLRMLLNYGIIGGLGGGKELGPGEEDSRSTLLNQYADLRKPGVYTLGGSFRLRHGQDLAWSPLTFTIDASPSRLVEKQMEQLLASHGLEGIHPCIIHGLQNNVRQIPALLKLHQESNTDPKPGKQRSKSRAERNAPISAAKSMVLMSDKQAVFSALEKVIAGHVTGDDQGFTGSGASLLYRVAITPASLPIVEQSLDSSNYGIRSNALIAALTMGSGKALELLPAALRSDNLSLCIEARDAAFHYLLLADERSGAHLQGISTEHLQEYKQALLKGFIDEERVFEGMTSSEKYRHQRSYFFGFNEDAEFLEALVDATLASQSDLKTGAMLNYIANMHGPQWRHAPITGTERRAALVLHARTAVKQHPDPLVRGKAAIFLGFWKDTASVPDIEPMLDDPDVELRRAAQKAIIFMNYEPLLERSIDRLVEEDQDLGPRDVDGVARRLGMTDPDRMILREPMRIVIPTLPGERNPPPPPPWKPSAEEIAAKRAERKAILLDLARAPRPE